MCYHTVMHWALLKLRYHEASKQSWLYQVTERFRQLVHMGMDFTIDAVLGSVFDAVLSAVLGVLIGVVLSSLLDVILSAVLGVIMSSVVSRLILS